MYVHSCARRPPLLLPSPPPPFPLGGERGERGGSAGSFSKTCGSTSWKRRCTSDFVLFFLRLGLLINGRQDLGHRQRFPLPVVTWREQALHPSPAAAARLRRRWRRVSRRGGRFGLVGNHDRWGIITCCPPISCCNDKEWREERKAISQVIKVNNTMQGLIIHRCTNLEMYLDKLSRKQTKRNNVSLHRINTPVNCSHLTFSRLTFVDVGNCCRRR